MLAGLQVWQGVAILVLPASLRDLRSVFEKASVVRGIYIAPVNWAEIAQSGYAAVITERARAAAAAPLQQAYLSKTQSAATGTRVVAFTSANGGTGRSTIAEALAYELAVRMNTYTLLMSFDLPPTAVSHLRLHYAPNAMEYFARPGDGFAASIQSREGLEVILAPENSVDYQKAGEYSAGHKREPDSIYSLVVTSWMRSYAAVLLDLPAGETPWSLQGISAANTAVIVARCTMADMTATRHTLILLLERLVGEHRIPREAIYLVLNQVQDKAALSPGEFHQGLVANYGWAPPVAAVIPYLPAITRIQDEQVPVVKRVDELEKAIRKLADQLYPKQGLAGQNEEVGQSPKSRLRIPHIRFI